jgi:hypothetical protein
MSEETAAIAALEGIAELEEEPQQLAVRIASRPVDATVDLAPNRKSRPSPVHSDDETDSPRRRALVLDATVEVDMRVLRELQEKRRDQERRDQERAEALAAAVKEAELHAHANADGIFSFVRWLSELVERILPRDEAGRIIQSYANYALEHFMLSIGAISRLSLRPGGHSALASVRDLQQSQPIESWGDFVERVISLMKRHPLPPPAAPQFSTLRRVPHLVDGKVSFLTVDLIMTDAFWMAVREHINKWQELGARERDIDLSLLPEFLERLRGVPLPRVGAAMRVVCKDMLSLFSAAGGPCTESSTFVNSQSLFSDFNSESEESPVKHGNVINASENGGQRPFSRFAPSRRIGTPEPLMEPLVHTQERCIPHVQAVAVLHSNHSHYASGVTLVVNRTACFPNSATSPTPGQANSSAALPHSGRLFDVRSQGILRFPVEQDSVSTTPHTMFDLSFVQRMRNVPGSASRRTVSPIDRSTHSPSSALSTSHESTSLEVAKSHDSTTLRSRLTEKLYGVDPDAASMTLLRHASLRRAAATRHRRPVRLVALEGLVGMHEHVAGEDVESHWQRLLSMRFKLSVLRGSGMPTAQRNLWKHLWDCCFAAIREIGENLRREILGTAAAPADNGDGPQHLVNGAIEAALDEHLRFDRQLTDFNRRALTSFGAIVSASGVVSPTKSKSNSSSRDISQMSFSRPLERRERGGSYLDREFLRDGVAAINTVVDKRLAARTRTSRSPLASPEHLQTRSMPMRIPSRSAKNAPNGFALVARLRKDSASANRAFFPKGRPCSSPDELHVSSIPIGGR